MLVKNKSLSSHPEENLWAYYKPYDTEIQVSALFFQTSYYQQYTDSNQKYRTRSRHDVKPVWKKRTANQKEQPKYQIKKSDK